MPSRLLSLADKIVQIHQQHGFASSRACASACVREVLGFNAEEGDVVPLPDTLAGVRNALAAMEREPEGSEVAQDGREGSARVDVAQRCETPILGKPRANGVGF